MLKGHWRMQVMEYRKGKIQWKQREEKEWWESHHGLYMASFGRYVKFRCY